MNKKLHMKKGKRACVDQVSSFVSGAEITRLSDTLCVPETMYIRFIYILASRLRMFRRRRYMDPVQLEIRLRVTKGIFSLINGKQAGEVDELFLVLAAFFSHCVPSFLFYSLSSSNFFYNMIICCCYCHYYDYHYYIFCFQINCGSDFMTKLNRINHGS